MSDTITIIHKASNSGTTKELYTIIGNTSKGTFGDYLLLKQYYMKLTILELIGDVNLNLNIRGDMKELKTVNVVKQFAFNRAFIEGMEKLYKNLWCVYCGKENLEVDAPKRTNNLATADHFDPTSIGGEAYSIDNLEVCCFKCNIRKSDKTINREDIKYPYPNKEIGKLTIKHNNLYRMEIPYFGKEVMVAIIKNMGIELIK